MPIEQDLPTQTTAKGYQLHWQHQSLFADNPLSAWQGLLQARGLHEGDPFFSPKLSDLPDPLLMQDMAKASERIVAAVQAKEHIHIFGDFDCDGVSGTAILVQALRATGAKVSCSIPHRSDDGHGIGAESVQDAVNHGAGLGISVDTGTTCFAACDKAQQLSFDLIITDHHLPETQLPQAFAILNPAREDCGFAERKLCGTGVAFFLLMQLWKSLRQQGNAPDFDLRSLLDRVAIATVADVMPLQGVNRILVFHGLQRLNKQPCVGLQALLQVAKVKKQVNVETIGFYLAPRINAAGRMRHGEEAMRMLIAENMDEALALAKVLDETNKQRRLVEADVFKQAESKLADTSVLAVYDDAWHAGVVGLAAGRLSRKYQRPAAVGFITPEGQIRVSLRGRKGFHIGQLLNDCSACLEGFGGHAGAGGGTIKTGQWQAFVKAFGMAVQQQALSAGAAFEQKIDGVLGLQAMHIGLAERLARFEPIGQGNQACTWLIRHVSIANRRNLRGGVVRLQLDDGHCSVDAIAFAASALDDYLQPGQCVSLVGQLQRDDWRGNGAVQFVVSDALQED